MRAKLRPSVVQPHRPRLQPHGGALVLAAATLVAAGIRFRLSLTHLRGLTEQRYDQLEDAARAEQTSRAALEAAMHDHAVFPVRSRRRQPTGSQEVVKARIVASSPLR